jgi:hypothetical protein
MQVNRSPGDSGPASSREAEISNAEEDCKWQGRVLAYVIEEDPHQLSEPEIIRELAGEQPEFDQADNARRAIEGLVRAGILRRCETLILLTKPARHFASLEMA